VASAAGPFSKKRILNHVMGLHDEAFSSNVSIFCLLQAVGSPYIHCSNVSLCHTPTLEFHGRPLDGRKRQDTEFSLMEARLVCSRHDSLRFPR
jgi:hypothetical protein